MLELLIALLGTIVASFLEGALMELAAQFLML